MNKNKCAIFCASSIDPNQRYLSRVKELVNLLSKEYDIVYGGSNTGYMKAVAQQVIDSQGTLIGIMPKFLEWKELRFEACHQWIETDSMNSRKEKMIELSDVFVALPGGVGTYEEVIDVISWKHIGLLDKPIVLVNYDNYFLGLESQINRGIEDGFILESIKESILFSDNNEDIMEFLQSYQSQAPLILMDEHRNKMAKVISVTNIQSLKNNEYYLVAKLILKKNDEVLLEKDEFNNWSLPGKAVGAYETSKEVITQLINLDLNLSYQSTINQVHTDYYLVDAESQNLKIDMSNKEWFNYNEVVKLIESNVCDLKMSQLAILFPNMHML